MFHAIYHPNLWNYCQLISLFVSQYQPMINQTLRSSTNKQYSIPTFHLFTKSGDTRQPSNFVLEHLQTSFFHLLPEPSSVYCSLPQKILLCVNFLLKISPGPLPLLSVDHSCLFSAGLFLLPLSSCQPLGEVLSFSSSAAFLKSTL